MNIHSGIEHFIELGLAVEEEWRSANYNEQDFSRIASAALENARIFEKVAPDDVMKWVLESPTLPHQTDAAGHFGQPPVTLFVAPRFCVDVYFWLESTTSIHQHSFCGAFSVLGGSSVHSLYRFENRQLLNPRSLCAKIA